MGDAKVLFMLEVHNLKIRLTVNVLQVTEEQNYVV